MLILYTLEYIWIDADNNLRSKTKILTREDTRYSSRSEYIKYGSLDIQDVPEWSFDGSSTGQATGNKSDVILHPVYVCLNPFYETDRKDKYLVLCAVYDGDKPHISNNYHDCDNVTKKYSEHVIKFGLEQEYIIYQGDKPYKWTNNDKFEQGPYYCGVGGNVAFGREIVNEHLNKCLAVKLEIKGTNAEVMPSQWEFQLGELNAVEMGHQLWLARYILNRVAEKHGCWINYHPKPLVDYNGSGCHINISTKKTMSSSEGMKEIERICKKFEYNHKEHIAVYGKDNDLRLTGIHETASIDKFNYGTSDRGASIRIPPTTAKQGFGYFEDRRPASNIDPYLALARIVKTICED